VYKRRVEKKEKKEILNQELSLFIRLYMIEDKNKRKEQKKKGGDAGTPRQQKPCGYTKQSIRHARFHRYPFFFKGLCKKFPECAPEKFTYSLPLLFIEGVGEKKKFFLIHFLHNKKMQTKTKSIQAD
jgi:hypothetical protein